MNKCKNFLCYELTTSEDVLGYCESCMIRWKKSIESGDSLIKKEELCKTEKELNYFNNFKPTDTRRLFNSFNPSSRNYRGPKQTTLGDYLKVKPNKKRK